MTPRPRVLLADEHAMLLDALRSLLETEYEVVGAARDGLALLELATKTRPDVIVLPISLPGRNGLDACQRLREALPGVKLVFLTVHEEPELAAEALRIGASGYLLKRCTSAELFTAIRATLKDEIYLTPLLRRGLSLDVFLRQAGSPHVDKLTVRQREVVQLLAEGRSMKEVAVLLNLSSHTVAFHKYTIMRLLGLRTSAELVQYAVQHHMVVPKV